MAIEVSCGGEGSGLGPWMRQVCRSRCLPSAKGTTGMHPLPQGLGLGKASLRPPRPCTENAEPGAMATCLLPARGPGLGVCKAGVRWHSLLCSQLRGGIFLQSRWQEREEESIVLWGRKPGEGRGAGGRGSAVGLGDSRPPRRGHARTKPPFPVTDSAGALSSHIALVGGWLWFPVKGEHFLSRPLASITEAKSRESISSTGEPCTPGRQRFVTGCSELSADPPSPAPVVLRYLRLTFSLTSAIPRLQPGAEAPRRAGRPADPASQGRPGVLRHCRAEPGLNPAPPVFRARALSVGSSRLPSTFDAFRIYFWSSPQSWEKGGATV